MSVYDNNDNAARFAWQQNNAAGFSNTLGSTTSLTMAAGGGGVSGVSPGLQTATIVSQGKRDKKIKMKQTGSTLLMRRVTELTRN